MSDNDVERVQVNVRVDKSVKDAFDEEIIKTFGTLGPYAGIELEREFRSFLDHGDITDLKSVVEDIAAVYQDTDRKKKIRESNREDSTTVGYRISDELRREMKVVAKDDYRSFGKLVESIMYNYVTEGSIIQRMTGDLQQVLESVEEEQDDSLGAKDRRTQTIATNLESRVQDAFSMADLEEAIEAASGIGASAYTKKEYLPRILEALNFTWDPDHPGWFINCDEYNVPNIRDLTSKPYLLMDREDKRKAIKIAAYRSANQQSLLFNVEDATAVLQGRPKRSTVKALMREIASSTPGYEYSTDHDTMKVSPKVVADNPSQNLDVIAVEHTAKGWIDSAVDSLLQLCKDVDHGLRGFPDPVLDKVIAESKYPALLSGDNPRDRTIPDYTTQSDRDKVLERLADELREPSIDIYSDRHKPLQ